MTGVSAEVCGAFTGRGCSARSRPRPSASSVRWLTRITDATLRTHDEQNAADLAVDGAHSPAHAHSVTTYAITDSFFSNACLAARAASQLSK